MMADETRRLRWVDVWTNGQMDGWKERNGLEWNKGRFMMIMHDDEDEDEGESDSSSRGGDQKNTQQGAEVEAGTDGRTNVHTELKLKQVQATPT